MAVFFEKTGALSAGTWTLRNVSLDWSQPIPEPAPALSIAVGLIALGLRDRRRVRG